MSETVISVENLSKQYRLGIIGTGTLREDMIGWWHRVRGKENPFSIVGETNDQGSFATTDHVWALKDVSFDVKQGEILGIIGKNGAGKSTLLKMLSRVTAPTNGVIKAKGRIASLLEVGTGFHPELTGRENIYLNGAIMGMKKREISSKLDEIVDFAGVERYLDTPVKRYSSGMYVRLGFAVAAHLEPEILIVDEVLAVGDAEFQKKALGKMKDVSSGGGRTVLFVSHNMASIKSLCPRTLLLKNGQVLADTDTDTAISMYMGGDPTDLGGNRVTFDSAFNHETFQLHEISLQSSGTNKKAPLSEESEIELHTDITLKSKKSNLYHVTYHLHGSAGDPLFSFSSKGLTLNEGRNYLSCVFPKAFFQSGEFFLSIYIVEKGKGTVFFERDILRFIVVDRARESGGYMGREPGYIRPRFEWRINETVQ